MTCKCCGGMLIFLGQLGRLIWLRCQHCGCDQSCEPSDYEDANFIGGGVACD